MCANELHFRPRVYSAKGFGVGTTASSALVMDCASRVVREVGSGRILVDVRGTTVAELQRRVFRRLSSQLFVHGFFPCASGKLDLSEV